MATLYIPDTNILVHLVRNDRNGLRIKERYALLKVEPRPLISIVTAGELRSLAYKFQWGKTKVDETFFLLNHFQKVSLNNEDILEAYATLDAYSVSIGRSMGKNDLWIAATAKVTGATLLTTDRDFDHLAPQFLTRALFDVEE